MVEKGFADEVLECAEKIVAGTDARQNFLTICFQMRLCMLLRNVILMIQNFLEKMVKQGMFSIFKKCKIIFRY